MIQLQKNRVLELNKNVRTLKRVGTWNADFKEDFMKRSIL